MADAILVGKRRRGFLARSRFEEGLVQEIGVLDGDPQCVREYARFVFPSRVVYAQAISREFFTVNYRTITIGMFHNAQRVS